MSGENWLIDGLVAGGETIGLCDMRLVCVEGMAVVPIRLTDRRVSEAMNVCVACANEARARYNNVEIVGEHTQKRRKPEIKQKVRLTRDMIKDIILVAAARPEGCRYSQIRDEHGFPDTEGRKAVIDLETDGLLIREPPLARLKDATLHYPDEF